MAAYKYRNLIKEEDRWTYWKDKTLNHLPLILISGFLGLLIGLTIVCLNIMIQILR